MLTSMVASTSVVPWIIVIGLISVADDSGIQDKPTVSVSVVDCC